MVCAFEKSLCTMTNRIQQLSRSSSEKESELNRVKLLVSRLLDVDDLRPEEIEQLLDDLNQASTKETLNDRHPKLTASKQLVRRHTFTADEMQLSKCKSLETCAKLEPGDANGQKKNKKQGNDESPKAPSSWLKFKKSLKKSSLSKFSPIHKASSSPKKDEIRNENDFRTDSTRNDSVISSILKASEDRAYQFTNDEEDTNLLINLSSNMCNLSSTVSLNSNQSANSSIRHSNKVRLLDDEQLAVRKELDEKEKQLCDLRLEALTNAHQMTNLKEYLNRLMGENERLSRLIKEKSMASSQFSLAESNASAGNASNVSAGNVSVCNISLSNASNTSNCNTSLGNESINTAMKGTAALTTLSNGTSNLSNGLLSELAVPNESVFTKNDNVLSNETVLSNALSNYPIVGQMMTNTPQSTALTIDRQHLMSSNSIASSELHERTADSEKIDSPMNCTMNGQMNGRMSDNALRYTQNDQFNKANSHSLGKASNYEANDCMDVLLKEGKLVSVQFDLWNEHFIAQQRCTKPASDQSASRLNRTDAGLSNEIGLLRISKQTKWSDLNRSLKTLIGNYLHIVDPNRTLSIDVESICSYELGGSKKTFYFDFNERLPSENEKLDQLVHSLKNGHLDSPTVDRGIEGLSDNNNSLTENKKEPIEYLSGDANLTVRLKCKSMLESFVLQTLVPKTVLIRLIGQLSDNNRKLIIAGPPGTGKTQLAHKLAEYLIVKLNKDGFLNSSTISESSSLLSSESSNSFKSATGSSAGSNVESSVGLSAKNELNRCPNRSTAASRIPVGSIATYCIDAANSHSLHHYLASLVQEIERSRQQADQFDKIDYRNVAMPSILIIDNLQFVPNIDEAFSSLLQLKNSPYMPFVIGTLNQGADLSIQQTASNQSSNHSIANCCEAIDRSPLSHRTVQLNLYLPLSNSFRWFTLDGHTEPVAGHLSRTLRKKVLTRCIEQMHDYLSEFNLLNIESKQRSSKDQSLAGIQNVLADLVAKKELSIALIDWLDSAWKHINHFIESHRIGLSAISSNIVSNGLQSPAIIGPRLLTDNFPINEQPDKAKDWFNHRWNRQIVPYLEQVTKSTPQPVQVEHPSIWILKTYPFSKLSNGQ